MTWRNPWKRIRDLELALADRNARLDEARISVDEAEARAWDRAARRWSFDLEREREANKQLLARMADISSLTPTAFKIPIGIWEIHKK